MEKFGQWVNKALMLDLFLVFFFFAWLVVAVVGDKFSLNLGLSLWQQLWEPLIQPAIGIVMAGAILSGVFSKFKKAK